ncbi:unnamed protein product [Protopolystoma xenopodis]|uniref:Uncharacterized protein n=1 Tax=Protopolystoma xenopodis TaxID=117903 RepID=A0A3S5FDK5_9PLAT|nr:unnamed protein product [Protopolystoma xenopodis]
MRVEEKRESEFDVPSVTGSSTGGRCRQGTVDENEQRPSHHEPSTELVEGGESNMRSLLGSRVAQHVASPTRRPCAQHAVSDWSIFGHFLLQFAHSFVRDHLCRCCLSGPTRAEWCLSVFSREMDDFHSQLHFAYYSQSQ